MTVYDVTVGAPYHSEQLINVYNTYQSKSLFVLKKIIRNNTETLNFAVHARKLMSTCSIIIFTCDIFLYACDIYCVDMQYHYVNMRGNFVKMRVKLCCMST